MMQSADPLAVEKFWVSLLGVIGTLVAAALAIQSFRRAQKWKRAEFLAAAMKDFFGDTRIQRALTMVDWGVRRIQLLDSDQPDAGFVIVTREMQIRALKPHLLLGTEESDAESADGSPGVQHGKFTAAEASIRDCYDAFLDGLERLSSYEKTKLIDLDAIRPYIGYWIDDIHAPADTQLDAAWTASLLTYITFYRFDGVISLFKAFHRNIDKSSSAYWQFLRGMSDQQAASRLAKSVKLDYPAQP